MSTLFEQEDRLEEFQKTQSMLIEHIKYFDFFYIPREKEGLITEKLAKIEDMIDDIQEVIFAEMTRRQQAGIK